VTTLAASKNTVTQTVNYLYNLDDSLSYLTDPTGRTDVTYFADGAVSAVFTTLAGLNSGGNPLIQKVSYTYYWNAPANFAAP